MLHEPAHHAGPDHAASGKMKLGVWMFLAYAIFYGGFVAINTIKPVLMEKVVLFGLNLAVVYGMGLIVVALILALVYNHLCGGMEKRLNSDTAQGGE